MARGYYLHESSIVDEGCAIGEGTKIWHCAHVRRGSRVGRRCVVGRNVSIGPDVTVGDGCKIQNNVSLYTGVTLEDDVFVGPSAVFTNVRTPRAFISRAREFAPTLVRRGATIGANATIVCGVAIGRYALVGAGAVVTADVPDHGLVAGVPARLIGHVCACGATLSFRAGKARCVSCGRGYAKRRGGIAPLGKGAA